MILHFLKVRIKKINIIYTKYNVWSIIYFVKAYVREVNACLIFSPLHVRIGVMCAVPKNLTLLDISVGPTSVRALVTRLSTVIRFHHILSNEDI